MKKQRTARSSKSGIWIWVAVAACTAAVAFGTLLRKSSSSSLHAQGSRMPASSLPPADQERALRAEQLQAAEKLAGLFPDNDDATYLLGLVHEEQGDRDAAMRHWERSLQLDASRAD